MAVMIEEGEYNSNYAYILENLPDQKGRAIHLEHIGIDLDDLLPRDQVVLRYRGSLTTPPCLEGVEWLVFNARIQFSASRIEKLSSRISPNARPVQPVGKARLNYGTTRLVEMN
jgi:carbonic anhydrase